MKKKNIFLLYIISVLFTLIECSSIALLTAPDGCRAGLPCLQQPIKISKKIKIGYDINTESYSAAIPTVYNITLRSTLHTVTSGGEITKTTPPLIYNISGFEMQVELLKLNISSPIFVEKYAEDPNYVIWTVYFHINDTTVVSLTANVEEEFKPRDVFIESILMHKYSDDVSAYCNGGLARFKGISFSYFGYYILKIYSIMNNNNNNNTNNKLREIDEETSVTNDDDGNDDDEYINDIYYNRVNIVQSPVVTLGIISQPTFEKGGIIFKNQPQVSLVDMGNNRIYDGLHIYTVTAEIVNGPDSVFADPSCKTVIMLNGLANFTCLAINTAGNYTLRFTTNHPWVTPYNYVDTVPFEVQRGVAARVEFERICPLWIAGSPCENITVLLYDAGGNLANDWSPDRVILEIDIDPTFGKATLGSNEIQRLSIPKIFRGEISLTINGEKTNPIVFQPPQMKKRRNRRNRNLIEELDEEITTTTISTTNVKPSSDNNNNDNDNEIVKDQFKEDLQNEIESLPSITYIRISDIYVDNEYYNYNIEFITERFDFPDTEVEIVSVYTEIDTTDEEDDNKPTESDSTEDDGKDNNTNEENDENYTGTDNDEEKKKKKINKKRRLLSVNEDDEDFDISVVKIRYGCKSASECYYIHPTGWKYLLNISFLVNGSVGFVNNINIDKEGINYRLRAYLKSHPQNIGYSPFFNVIQGDPVGIEVYREAGGAWGLHNSYTTQPVIRLYDAGGNTVTRDVDNVTVNCTDINGNSEDLFGDLSAMFVDGYAEFTNLYIFKLGDFILHFTAVLNPKYPHNIKIYANQSIHVGETIEYEYLPSDGEEGDDYGRSISLTNDTLVVGAPNKNIQIKEVQIVETHCHTEHLSGEIVYIRGYTEAKYAEDQLDFNLNNNNEENEISYLTGGYYLKLVLKSNTYYSSCIPVDYREDQLYVEIYKSFCKYDPSYCDIEVTSHHSSNTIINKYSYNITYYSLINSKSKLEIYTNNSCNVTEATPVFSNRISGEEFGGKFSLFLEGNETPLIDVDDNEEMTKQIMNLNWNYTVLKVEKHDIGIRKERLWMITFDAEYSHYDVPTITYKSQSLKGKYPFLDITTVKEGEAPIHGTFKLKFRGETTKGIQFNANEAEFKQKLQDLHVFDTVTVERLGPYNKDNYRWIITFDKVADWNIFDNVHPIKQENFEPLEVLDDGIQGTNAEVKVISAYTQPSRAPWLTEVMGSPGNDSGVVYIYNKYGIEWIESQIIAGHDTTAEDHFGYSVSCENDIILVGAPGAETIGQLRVDEITCRMEEDSSEDTYIIFNKDGIVTNEIAPNSTVDELEKELKRLFEKIEISPFRGPMCTESGNTFYITFLWDRDPHRMDYNIETHNLEGEENGYANKTTIRSRISQATGNNSTYHQTGKAYIFQRINDTKNWIEKYVIYPPNIVEGSEFGHQVQLDLEHNTFYISAPSANYNKGFIYIYKYDDFSSDSNENDSGEDDDMYNEDGSLKTLFNYPPKLLQTISYESAEPKDFYSHSFEIGYSYDDEVQFLFVGAMKQGSVYIYTRKNDNEIFRFNQVLYSPVENTEFGSSIKFYNDTLLISAPYYNNRRGIVYYFDLNRRSNTFHLKQTLNPSDNEENDMFGRTIEVNDNVLAITNSRDVPSTKRNGTRIVFEVQTYPEDNNTNITGTFYFEGDPRRRQPNQLCHINNDLPCHEKDYFMGCKRCSNSEWEFKTTYRLRYNASAYDVRIALEEMTNYTMKVTREGTYMNSYRWLITFEANKCDIPRLIVHNLLHSGNIKLSVINSPPDLRRRTTYLYLRDNSIDDSSNERKWAETALLMPTATQCNDYYGYTSAMYDNMLVIGSPNRDTVYGSTNSGGIFYYVLKWLDLGFEKKEYKVTESEGYVNLNLMRCKNGDCLFSDEEDEIDIRYITGDELSPSVIPPHLLERSLIRPGTAISQSDCLLADQLKHDCKWSYGQYMLNGHNDYVNLNERAVFQPYQMNYSVQIVITNDRVVEVPDEYFNIRLTMPGMIASPVGAMTTKVIITDDNEDGYIDKETGFVKFISPDVDVLKKFGEDATFCDNYLFVGSPHKNMYDDKNVGVVYMYVKDKQSGRWNFVRRIYEPGGISPGRKFGNGVITDCKYLIISSPEIRNLYIYKIDKTNNNVIQYETLDLSKDVISPEGFGRSHTMIIREDKLYLGLSYINEVRIYSLANDNNNNENDENATETDIDEELTATDRDDENLTGTDDDNNNSDTDSDDESKQFDLNGENNNNSSTSTTTKPSSTPQETIRLLQILRPSEMSEIPYPAIEKYQPNFLFGYSIAIANNTLLVGAPQGGLYRPMKPYLFETVKNDNQKDDNDDSTEEDEEGSEITNTENEFTTEIEIDNEENGYKPSTIPSKGLYYHDYDGIIMESTGMVYMYLFNTTAQEWNEVRRFTPEEKEPMRYGTSVAIDYNYFVVGAPRATNMPSVTWDFESGDLHGWILTGEAFNNQPTYGDNPRYRLPPKRIRFNDYTISGHSNLDGRYYIGTYEDHHVVINMTTGEILEEKTKQGSIQGDKLMGTMTSPTFVIEGNTIQFKLGGGCDIKTIYVELIVEGMVVYSNTGKCKEEMEIVTWNVTQYKSKGAIIRIVDNADSYWGHINVDSFSFDWPIEGKSSSFTSFYQRSPVVEGGKAFLYKHELIIEEKHAEFRYYCNDYGDANCTWVLENELIPSDRHSYQLFGEYVAIDYMNQIIAVSSPGSFNIDTLNSTVNKYSGAIYLYSPYDITPFYNFAMRIKTYQRYESMIYRPIDNKPEDRFGMKLQLLGTKLLITSPYAVGLNMNSGAVFIMDANIVHAKIDETTLYDKDEMRIKENYPAADTIYITMTRSENLNSSIDLSYSTTDITAVGMDKADGNYCLWLNADLRDGAGCGDYIHATGFIHFYPYQTTRNIMIKTITKTCSVDYEKRFKVSITGVGMGKIYNSDKQVVVRIKNRYNGLEKCESNYY